MERETHTLPGKGATRVSVRSLCVDVTDGPDAGRTCVATSDRLSIGTAHGNDVVLVDPTVSRFHAQLSREPEGVSIEDRGSTNGTFVGAVRVERALVPPGTSLTIGRTTLRIRDGEDVDVEIHGGEALGGLFARSPIMRRLLAQLQRAAQSEVSTLLTGESGTGKERFARALHELGPRAGRAFETVDCASLSPTLVASELFGHERGAFTGADRKHVGAFERADGGTLFLDEIGELPESLQPALLGALERRRFRRLGGRDEIAVDVRVVSATNRDLRAEVNAGKFRLDLFYRVAVVRLEIPPLRARLDDIPLLIEHFARDAGYTGPIEQLISPETMGTFLRHYWPGNVRELRNVVDATLAMGETPVLEDSSPGIPAGTPAQVAVPGLHIALEPTLEQPYKEARLRVLNQFEAAYLPRLLERAGGNVSQAARDADMDRSHLWDMLRRHGLR